MFDKKKMTLVLGTTALVLGATIAIAGSSSERLKRHATKRSKHALASSGYIKGVQSHRFKITVQTLRTWRSGPTPPIVVDIRAPSAYEAGHIANAINRPAADLLSGKAKLGATKGHQVVLYDQDGRFASLLVHPLRRGKIDAYLLAGGYAAWMSPHAPHPGNRHEADHPPKKAAEPSAASSAAGSSSAAAPAAPVPEEAAPPTPAAPPAAAAPDTDPGGGDDEPPADEGC